MKRSFSVSFIALALIASPAAAQWPSFVRKEIPRTTEGKPNFDTPAPRAPDGHIDLTGVYENLWFYQGRIGRPPVSPPGEPPQTTFGEIGAGFKEGLPFRPWARELYQQRKMGENPPSREEAIRLMAEDPNLILRPLIRSGDRLLARPDEATLEELVG